MSLVYARVFVTAISSEMLLVCGRFVRNCAERFLLSLHYCICEAPCLFVLIFYVLRKMKRSVQSCENFDPLDLKLSTHVLWIFLIIMVNTEVQCVISSQFTCFSVYKD